MKEREVKIWLVIIFGIVACFFALIIILFLAGFGTGISTSASYDGEKNMECYNVRINHENIFKTYHYEMKCFPYENTKEEKIR